MADAIAVASGTADSQMYTGSGEMHGFSCRESAAIAAAATFILRDGTSAAGTALAYVEVAANASETVSFAESVEFQTGLYLDRVAGETEVTAYVT